MKSIWAPRALDSDARALLDTEAAEFRRFEQDWKLVLELGVAKLIVKSDDEGAADVDGDGIADEIAEVMEVMWEYHSLCNILFAFFACLGSDFDDTLSFNEWAKFVDDFGIASQKAKYCKRADMDRLFIAVDTKSAMLGEEQRKQLKEQKPASRRKSTLRRSSTLEGGSGSESGSKPSSPNASRPDSRGGPGGGNDGGQMATIDAIGQSMYGRPASPAKSATGSDGASQMGVHDTQKKALSRVEFLAALVHIAIYKYVMTKKEMDVSEGLRRLFSKDLEPKMSSPGFAPPNHFRRAHCYNKHVSRALEKHVDSLRFAFDALAAARSVTRDEKKYLGYRVFEDFCKACGLIGADVTERDCMLCFSWSRMCVCDVSDHVGRVREAN